MNRKYALDRVYAKYWSEYPPYLTHAEVLRHAFHLEVIGQKMAGEISICDIGGGWGAFSAGAALMGMRSILVDDFADNGFFDENDNRHRMANDFGFVRVCRDVVKDGLSFEPNSIDVFTSFDSMEHWHHSPKTVFKQIMEILRPGGLFLLGVPNAVNLRKRISTPLGMNKWSSMEDWYETPVFRGHVREPDVGDLRYMAKDMGLQEVEIIGRNWQGYLNSRAVVRTLSAILDRSLRFVPSLCSDIYLMGRKPG